MTRVFTFNLGKYLGVFVYNDKTQSIATITKGTINSFNQSMVGYPGTIDAVVSFRPVNANQVWCVVHGRLDEIKKAVDKPPGDYFKQHFYSGRGIDHFFEIVAPFHIDTTKVSIQLTEVKSRKLLRDTLDILTDPVASALYFGFESG